MKKLILALLFLSSPVFAAAINFPPDGIPRTLHKNDEAIVSVDNRKDSVTCYLDSGSTNDEVVVWKSGFDPMDKSDSDGNQIVNGEIYTVIMIGHRSTNPSIFIQNFENYKCDMGTCVEQIYCKYE